MTLHCQIWPCAKTMKECCIMLMWHNSILILIWHGVKTLKQKFHPCQSDTFTLTWHCLRNIYTMSFQSEWHHDVALTMTWHCVKNLYNFVSMLMRHHVVTMSQSLICHYIKPLKQCCISVNETSRSYQYWYVILTKCWHNAVSKLMWDRWHWYDILSKQWNV